MKKYLACVITIIFSLSLYGKSGEEIITTPNGTLIKFYTFGEEPFNFKAWEFVDKKDSKFTSNSNLKLFDFISSEYEENGEIVRSLGLLFENNSTKSISGLKFTVNIKNTFNENLASYPVLLAKNLMVKPKINLVITSSFKDITGGTLFFEILNIYGRENLVLTITDLKIAYQG